MSDIVYTPPYVPSLKDYQLFPPSTPTLFELILRQGIRINKAAESSANNDMQVVYTVPDGFDLFIIAAGLTMSSREDADNAIYGYMAITTTTFSTINYYDTLIRTQLRGYPLNQLMNVHAAHDYTVPIKVSAGEKVVIYNAQSDSTTGGYIVGYLLPNGIKSI